MAPDDGRRVSIDDPICEKCAGRGVVNESSAGQPCPECDGFGRVGAWRREPVVEPEPKQDNSAV